MKEQYYLYMEGRFGWISYSLPYHFDTIEKCKHFAQTLEGDTPIEWEKPVDFFGRMEIAGKGKRRGEMLISDWLY